MKKPIKHEFQYQHFPALAAYIDGIGAEQLNFRRFMVKQHKGHYYVEKALININSDGSIDCRHKEYRPTEAQSEAIKIELAGVIEKWPKAVGAKTIEELVKILKVKKETLFEFYDRKSGLIKMVQQKLILPDGSKKYIPWTRFSDGSWMSMEPDGELPFWKPRKRLSAKIMIHEGAKCGAYAHWLTTSTDKEAEALRKTHPWADELCEYEHWGMIGGALAPHRTDYEELAREKPLEVVYMCDNDWKGKKALELMSPCWGKALKGIKVDRAWPEGWDIADPFTTATCPKLFAESGRYIGKTIKDLLSPATYATKTVTTAEGAGRPVIVIREEFMQEWFHCVTPEVFIHKDKPNKEYVLSEFNNLIAPFSQSKETGALIKRDSVQKGVKLTYIPAESPGIGSDRYGNVTINMHVPTNIKMEKGDLSIWTDYIESLLPDPIDREYVLKWIATLIDHPEEKMSYALLLISETQGVGKTTLGQDILDPILGETNTSYPNESDIVDSPFNYWSAQKRLAVINEIYSGDNSKAYNKLKSVIVDDRLSISKKYQNNYFIDNWVHLFACSNSLKALKIETGERRWLIPEVSSDTHDNKYWNRLHDWLDNDNGLGKIMYWAKLYCKKNGYVKKGERAPDTKTKLQVAAEGTSPGLNSLTILLETIKEITKDEKEAVFTTDVHLQEYLRDVINGGVPSKYLERLLTIRRHAKSKDWFISKEDTAIGAFGGGPFTKAKILFSKSSDKLLTAKELLEKGRKPFNLKGLTTKF